MKKKSQPGYKKNPKNNVIEAVKINQFHEQWRSWVVVAMLMIITWYLYKPSLDNHFTNWDDNFYVLENPQVKQPIVQNTKYFFTHASASNYHPLTMVSLSLDYHLTVRDKNHLPLSGNMGAGIFHTTSLIFHLFNILLVFFFTWLLSRKRLVVATVVALLFAIHPMHVESVAWISERKDVLYTFFFLAGLIVYMKYLEKPSWLKLLLTGILFLASLFSKPSAVVFPLILLSVDYFYGRKFSKRVLYEKVPFFVLAGIFGMITFFIQGDVAVVGLKSITILQRLMFASYGFLMYPVKLLFPVEICSFYPYPGLNSSGNLAFIYYLSPLIAFGIIGLVYLSTRFTKVVGFGFLFYFFSILLVLQFMPVGKAIMADRYSYLSSIGLFFMAAWYLNEAMTSKRVILRSIRWIVVAMFVAYSFFLGKAAWEQTKVWHDSETLWTDVISKHPGADVAYKHRGNYYGTMNVLDKAENDYLTFLKINRDDAGVYNNLGNVYNLREENAKAIDAYSKSVALDSLDPKTFLNRAIIYSKTKQFTAAIMDFNKAISLNPGLSDVYVSRSVMYRDMGNYEEAINDFSRVIRSDPGNVNCFMDRGFCYFRLKKFPEALADFDQSIALNPANGHALYNISAIYNEMKDFNKAYEYALKAKSMGYPVNQNLLESLKMKRR